MCAHGYSGNGRDFDFLARALADAGLRVICPDFAGRGKSAWLPGAFQYNFPQFLADTRTLLAHLGVPEVEWIGTSMGGLLGMMLAAQPNTPVRRLVMNDVGAFLPMDALQAIARNLEAPLAFPSRRAVEEHLRHTHRDWGEITDEQWKHMALHHAVKSAGGFRLHFDPKIAAIARPMPLTPGLYFWDAWYRVRCPVLLVRGEHSRVFPADVAQAMLGAKPAARLVEIEDAGHAPGLMSPGEIGILREFLTSEPRAAAVVSRDGHERSRRILPPRTA